MTSISCLCDPQVRQLHRPEYGQRLVPINRLNAVLWDVRILPFSCFFTGNYTSLEIKGRSYAGEPTGYHEPRRMGRRCKYAHVLGDTATWQLRVAFGRDLSDGIGRPVRQRRG